MKKTFFAAILSFFLLIGTAQAVPITYYFGGVLGNDFGTLDAGSTFTGSFTYDDGAIPIGSNSYSAEYDLTDFAVLFNGVDTVLGTDSTIEISDYAYSMDALTINTTPAGGSVAGGVQVNYLRMDLYDYSGTVFNGTALPGVDITMDDFSVSSMLVFSATNGITGLGCLTFLSTDPTAGPAAPVPEPATIFLMGTGLASMAGFMRKRRTKK